MLLLVWWDVSCQQFHGKHTYQSYISYHAHGDGEVLEQGASNVINAAQKAVDEASRNTQGVRTSFGEL